MVFRCVNTPRANRISDDMNRLLSSFLGDTAPVAAPGPPAANLWEEDERWVIEMELPGISPEQVDLTVVGDEVTISVERPEAEPQEGTFFHRERPRGSFSRTFQMPAVVESKDAEAGLVHGVLTVRLPKAEAARRRKINIAAKS